MGSLTSSLPQGRSGGSTSTDTGPSWGTGGSLDAFGGQGEALNARYRDNPGLRPMTPFSSLSSGSSTPSLPSPSLSNDLDAFGGNGPAVPSTLPSAPSLPSTLSLSPSASLPTATDAASLTPSATTQKMFGASNLTRKASPSTPPAPTKAPSASSLTAKADKLREQAMPERGLSQQQQGAKLQARRQADLLDKQAQQLSNAKKCSAALAEQAKADKAALKQQQKALAQQTAAQKPGLINQFVRKAVADAKALKAQQAKQAQAKQAAVQARAGLPENSADTVASNGRLVDVMANRSEVGDSPRYQIDALNNGKDDVVAQYNNFLEQVHDRIGPERAQEYHDRVLEGLTPDAQAKLAYYGVNPQTVAEHDVANKELNPYEQLVAQGLVNPADAVSDRDLIQQTDLDALSDQLGTELVPAANREAPVISKAFRDAIHQRESANGSNNGYGAKHPNGVALGRYQMQEAALEDTGFIDDQGNWTGRHGVHSEKDFLSNPQAQDRAFDAYVQKTERYLKSKGSLASIGTTIDGVKAKFQITRGGLVAAAHRQGYGVVAKYLNHQKESGWKSNFQGLAPKVREKYLSVETRLREFSDIKLLQ